MIQVPGQRTKPLPRFLLCPIVPRSFILPQVPFNVSLVVSPFPFYTPGLLNLPVLSVLSVAFLVFPEFSSLLLQIDLNTISTLMEVLLLPTIILHFNQGVSTQSGNSSKTLFALFSPILVTRSTLLPTLTLGLLFVFSSQSHTGMDLQSFLCNGRRVLLPLDVMPIGHTYSTGFTQMYTPTSSRRRVGAYVLHVCPDTTAPISQLDIHKDLVNFGSFTPATARLALVDGQPPLQLC